MLKYRELKEKNKIKTCICTSLLPTCGQGEDKLMLCVTTYGRNADTTREAYKSACRNVNANISLCRLRCLTRGMGSATCADRWGRSDILGRRKVSVQSVAAAFPAVCFSRGVTNYLCKAITGGCTRAVYLCMGLCHCHSLFSCYLPIPSHPNPSVPSPFNLPPSSVMNSFSRLSLPITSLILPLFLTVLLSHPKKKRFWMV